MSSDTATPSAPILRLSVCQGQANIAHHVIDTHCEPSVYLFQWHPIPLTWQAFFAIIVACLIIDTHCEPPLMELIYITRRGEERYLAGPTMGIFSSSASASTPCAELVRMPNMMPCTRTAAAHHHGPTLLP